MDEDAIRRRAYEIWEREGRPQGMEAEHWNRARLELADENGSRSGTGGGTGWTMPVDAEALHGSDAVDRPAEDRPAEGGGAPERVDVGGRKARRRAPERDMGEGGGA
ncbi:DUF2934 domain-containing protein [Arenibaculum pallidiluteum]|uniref:DUF2934 domain-containing protein n=1 Tax=Arenibaculum pallidiluteum TaxID=2812559 RepID=UPI001A97567B|nr:DUF2934 domain-containing protein [Arenibaculum pallidiluteum]